MLQLDAEALYAELRDGVRAPAARPTRALVGIWSGGAWLAERLQRDLALPGAHGVISQHAAPRRLSARGLAAGSRRDAACPSRSTAATSC